MQRRLLALTIILGVASVAALGLYGLDRIDLSHSANDVDHVTLYQNGLAAISLVRPYEHAGPDVWLTFQLPTTTLFDSITVRGDGISVKEMRSELSASPVLHAGDQLVVHVRDGPRLEGTLLEQQGDQVLLATSEGSVLVKAQDIVAVEVKGRQVDPAETGTTVVSILVAATPGQHTVKLSYLAQGAGWSANHILDPTTGDFTFFATLSGLQDWQNVTLDLVAGSPNLVYEPSYSSLPSAPSFSLRGASAGGAVGDYDNAFQPSTSLGDLHKYHYPGKVTFRQGEVVRLPVASGKVDILRHYYEANAQPYASDSWTGLPEKYELRNALSEPLPAGPVRIYLDGEWVGADNLPTLGVGEVGNVTAARSGDVKMRVVQESQVRGDPMPNGDYGRRIRHVTTVLDIQVRNLRTGADATIDLRTTFQEGGYRVLSNSAQPAPTGHDGPLMVWDEHVGSGQMLHHHVTVESDEDV